MEAMLLPHDVESERGLLGFVLPLRLQNKVLTL